jgi:hypothetical protein
MNIDACLLRSFPELASEQPLPDGELAALRLAFVRTFLAFDLTLPDDAVKQRRAGRVEVGTGFALFQFGRDAAGEYVEVYVHHRMTNARHVRIRETGAVEDLTTSFDPFVPRSMWELYRGTDPDRDPS